MEDRRLLGVSCEELVVGLNFGVLATWKFRAARTGSLATWIRRKCGQNTVTETEREALEFAARIAEHFRRSDINTVQAWTVGPVAGAPDEIPGAAVCPIVPHANGKDWSVVECAAQHPLWIKNWEDAIDYMLFRARARQTAWGISPLTHSSAAH